MLSAPGLPSGARLGGGTRGTKKPGTPKVVVVIALARLRAGRIGSKYAGAMNGLADETRAQNACRRSSRASGVLPAIKAALTAPIETPVTQVGAKPCSAMPS